MQVKQSVQFQDNVIQKGRKTTEDAMYEGYRRKRKIPCRLCPYLTLLYQFADFYQTRIIHSRIFSISYVINLAGRQLDRDVRVAGGHAAHRRVTRPNQLVHVDDKLPTPTPPPSTLGKAGRNHLNEEIITPLLPTGIGERFSQTISNLGHECSCADVNPI